MKLFAATLLVSAAFAAPAFAQNNAPIKIINVGELSGPGATVGTNFKNSADLAVAEINAKGGILGRKIEIVHLDTQSNPVSRARSCKRRSMRTPTPSWARAIPVR